MNELQDIKVVNMVVGTQKYATNATATGYLDTDGYDYARIIIGCGMSHATTTAVFTALALTEGTNSAAASAIAAFTGGTATSSSVGFVLATNALTTAELYSEFRVDLRGRERYLRCVATPGVADSIYMVGLLSRGDYVSGSASTFVVNRVTG